VFLATAGRLLPRISWSAFVVTGRRAYRVKEWSYGIAERIALRCAAVTCGTDAGDSGIRVVLISERESNANA
jgi:hypothetical protein